MNLQMRKEKRRLFGAQMHTRKSWQEFCQFLWANHDRLNFKQMVKASKRIAGKRQHNHSPVRVRKVTA